MTSGSSTRRAPAHSPFSLATLRARPASGSSSSPSSPAPEHQALLPARADDPAEVAPPPRRDVKAGLAAVGAGALVALSLPPWGWWPLAFVGIAVLDRLVA